MSIWYSKYAVFQQYNEGLPHGRVWCLNKTSSNFGKLAKSLSLFRNYTPSLKALSSLHHDSLSTILHWVSWFLGYKNTTSGREDWKRTSSRATKLEHTYKICDLMIPNTSDAAEKSRFGLSDQAVQPICHFAATPNTAQRLGWCNECKLQISSGKTKQTGGINVGRVKVEADTNGHWWNKLVILPISQSGAYIERWSMKNSLIDYKYIKLFNYKYVLIYLNMGGVETWKD